MSLTPVTRLGTSEIRPSREALVTGDGPARRGGVSYEGTKLNREVGLKLLLEPR